jgi:predicted aspartyl protease
MYLLVFLALGCLLPSLLGLEIVLELLEAIGIFMESFALVEVKDRRATILILVLRGLTRALIGVITLEALGLTVDPTTGELKEVEILLL